jgi:hypothetical protein
MQKIKEYPKFKFTAKKMYGRQRGKIKCILTLSMIVSKWTQSSSMPTFQKWK